MRRRFFDTQEGKSHIMHYASNGEPITETGDGDDGTGGGEGGGGEVTDVTATA